MPDCFPTYGSADQAIRRFPGCKQTLEVAAVSLPRSSNKPRYPLYLLYLLYLLSPHPENRDIRYKGRIEEGRSFRARSTHWTAGTRKPAKPIRTLCEWTIDCLEQPTEGFFDAEGLLTGFILVCELSRSHRIIAIKRRCARRLHVDRERCT